MLQKLLQLGVLSASTAAMFSKKDKDKAMEDAENEQKKAQKTRKVDSMEKDKEEFIKNFRSKNKL